MTALAVTPESGTAPAERGSEYRPLADTADVALLGWQVLGWVGTALTIAAIGTIASVYVPARFGNVDWEFGIVSESLVAMPLLTVGLGGCLAAAVARQRSSVLLTLGVVKGTDALAPIARSVAEALIGTAGSFGQIALLPMQVPIEVETYMLLMRKGQILTPAARMVMGLVRRKVGLAP